MRKVVGLSLVQPRPWLVLAAGLRSLDVASRRAPERLDTVLIHAASGGSLDAFDAAVREMVSTRALPASVAPPWYRDMPRGGLVARARVVEFIPTATGGGLVIADVEPLPCLVPLAAPTPGHFFELDEHAFEQATARALSATSEAEFWAVARSWSVVTSVGVRARSTRAAEAAAATEA